MALPFQLIFKISSWVFYTIIQPPLILIGIPVFHYIVPVILLAGVVIYAFRQVKMEGWGFLLRNLEELLAYPFLAAIGYIVFMQVYFRYILDDPIVWAEEVTLLCFHWGVFIGAALAYKHGEKLTMETFVGQLPEHWQHKILIVIEVLIFFTLLLLLYQGIQVAILEWTYPSSALEFPQTYQSASFPVGMALMIIHSGRQLWALITNKTQLGHRSSPAV
ncbi:MAG: TRAP transporter small permease [Nitrospinae bacterium]|nr:TRAP transporter small permease [Nitrospinota bacterium]